MSNRLVKHFDGKYLARSFNAPPRRCPNLVA
jgi:hypothetical protein